MFHYIEKLRKEPTAKRQQTALTLTIVIVGFVVLIWILFLVLRFNVSSSTPAPLKSDDFESERGIISPY